MTPHTIEIEVFISRIGLGVTDIFTNSYSMLEHFDNIPNNEGKEVGADKYPNEIVAVNSRPLNDEVIEQELRRKFDLDESSKVICQIHNPMKSCFKSYTYIKIKGVDVLVKQCSTLLYAIINHQWIIELESINAQLQRNKS